MGLRRCPRGARYLTMTDYVGNMLAEVLYSRKYKDIDCLLILGSPATEIRDDSVGRVRISMKAVGVMV